MTLTDAMNQEITKLWLAMPAEHRPSWRNFMEMWLKTYGDAYREAIARGFTAPTWDVYSGISMLPIQKSACPQELSEELSEELARWDVDAQHDA